MPPPYHSPASMGSEPRKSLGYFSEIDGSPFSNPSPKGINPNQHRKRAWRVGLKTTKEGPKPLSLPLYRSTCENKCCSKTPFRIHNYLLPLVRIGYSHVCWGGLIASLLTTLDPILSTCVRYILEGQSSSKLLLPKCLHCLTPSTIWRS
jgi:hypothetical protein